MDLALTAPSALEQVAVQKTVVKNLCFCLDDRRHEGASFLQHFGQKDRIQPLLGAEFRERWRRVAA